MEPRQVPLVFLSTLSDLLSTCQIWAPCACCTAACRVRLAACRGCFAGAPRQPEFITAAESTGPEVLHEPGRCSPGKALAVAATDGQRCCVRDAAWPKKTEESKCLGGLMVSFCNLDAAFDFG